MVLREDMCLLDPCSNSPLKIYEADLDTIEESESGSNRLRSKFPLRMNKMEKEVNAHEGTLLLLGRSGTGIV